ncbi:DgyrCDS13416 [Dimorphilus gyrociliatus]|uniref:DgyrCDS13416 n=1 Tax=Dimorphilus gyrociliatus TaxID=2664684 RepID=A0A7I8WAK5_9ANNE|nr:DgyrCDS13416 [Dimorphilus gyrociliatus]
MGGICRATEALLEKLYNLLGKEKDLLKLLKSKEALKLLGSALGIYIVAKSAHHLYSLFLWRRQTTKALSQYPTPPRHWLYGHALYFKDRSKAFETIQKFSKDYNGAWINSIGPFSDRLIITKVKYAKDILSTAEPKEPYSYGFLKLWLGDGLLLSSGPKWFRSRRLLTPAFHFDILKPYSKLFSDCANTLINKWKDKLAHKENMDIELYNEISLLTLDDLLKCIFGQESNCQTSSNSHPYLEAVQNVTRLLMQRALNVLNLITFIYYLTPTSWYYLYNIHKLHSFTRKVIKERQALLKAKPDYTKHRRYLDFIDILLSARDENGKGLSDQEIADEVDTFMFEGHDTTAAGISFALYNLAKYPEIQEKCREEVMEVLGESDTVSWNDLSKLTYLTKTLKESLRVSPPVPSIQREITEERTLCDGRRLPKGVAVVLSIYAIHHDPDVWENPDKFDPERHSIRGERDPFAFVPFSAGPRNCIGQNFALNEMKATVAIVLKHFFLSEIKGFKAQPVGQVTIKSLNGLWVNLRPLKE